MKHDDRDEPMIANIRAALDRSVEQLDEPTLRRLQGGRQRAMQYLKEHAQEETARAQRRSPLWIPASGVAFASVVMLTLLLTQYTPSSMEPTDSFDDIELMVSGESLEFYDDLEFYLWLAQENRNAS